MNTPNEIGDRIRTAREAVGITQRQLAERFGWGQSRIGNYERGLSRPSFEDLQAIANALGIEVGHLAFGKPIPPAPSQAPGELDSSKYTYIRRLSAAAGMGRASENGHEEVDGRHAYRRDWLEKNKLIPSACVVIDATGDSMYPSISDGDVVLINTLERTIKNGSVYAFKTDEGARIKRLFKLLDGRVRVTSDNPDKLTYPDEFLTPGMEVQILGKVVHRSGGV